MRHSNISIFIPHSGCPYKCAFCDQHIISDTAAATVTGENVTEILRDACMKLPNPKQTEIAFFGGSFTALERSYMISLLEAALPFVGKFSLLGIRVSTRPDCIDNEVLNILKNYGVTAIELGAQSMCDHVLFANKRGHTANDVRLSSELIKNHDIELGLQMMTGLYQSSPEDEIYTANEIIKLSPATIRIYPVVILKGTRLASLYQSGIYKIPTFDDMISIGADLLEMFGKSSIKVIRFGLHASSSVEENIVGGYYHPALRDLCESILIRRQIELQAMGYGDFEVYVSTADLSKAIGQKKSNLEYFKNMGKNIRFSIDDGLHRNQIYIKKMV